MAEPIVETRIVWPGGARCHGMGHNRNLHKWIDPGDPDARAAREGRSP